MKNKALALCLITCTAIIAEVPENMLQKPTPDTYYTTKAYEAIIHDTYQEAMPYNKELPKEYKDALEKFGFADGEIAFYTAVRMNRFVEKVGNNIVLLHPNFFLYLTPEEQSAHIGVQLARIKAGDLSETRANNPEQKNLEKLYTFAKAAIAGSLAFHYRDALIEAAQFGLEHSKELLFSKTGAFITACALVPAYAHIAHTRKKYAALTEYELSVVDTMGPDELTKIRQRQVVWGKNNESWLRYQWYMFLGRLDLLDMPEVQLEKYKEHEAKKLNQ